MQKKKADSRVCSIPEGSLELGNFLCWSKKHLKIIMQVCESHAIVSVLFKKYTIPQIGCFKYYQQQVIYSSLHNRVTYASVTLKVSGASETGSWPHPTDSDPLSLGGGPRTPAR